MTSPSRASTTFRDWWNDPVDHYWVLNFLRPRGYLRPLRLLIGMGGVVMGVALVLVQFTPLTEPVALSRAIEVNEAFRILRDPVRRAEKLFEQQGIPTGEASQSKASPALLMEMMEAREELAEAARDKKLERVVALGAAMQKREGALVEKLAQAFAAAGSDKQKLAEAESILGELRYAKRYLDEVAAFEEALTE